MGKLATATDVWRSLGDWLVTGGVKILAVIVGAIVLRWVLNRLISRIVATIAARQDARPSGARGSEAQAALEARHAQRMATLGALLRSIVTVVIAIITALTVLALLDVPLAPLLASAGAGGVALGLGAQSLIKDFLSGIVMIIEDQYRVGDTIDTGEATGVVEDVTLRLTRIRDTSGTVWYVRNGEIVRVGNSSQGWANAIIDLPIAYDASVPDAVAALKAASEAFAKEPVWAGRILDCPEVQGVESVAAGSLTLRVVARCVSGEQLAVTRALRERLKSALDDAGIPGPPVVPATPSRGRRTKEKQ